MIFSPESLLGCELAPEKKFVSLSAPVTHLMEELGLMKDQALKAISVFHPVDKSETERLAGGLFLSAKTLKKYRSSVVFFDDSRELKRSLKQNKIKTIHEIKSRGLDPFAVNQAALEALSPYLEKCSANVEKLQSELKSIKKRLSKMDFKNRAYVFYLGAFTKGHRPPELVIADDGFVKYFKKLGMKTYPGGLAYLPWSQRKMEKLENVQRFGVHESEASELTVKKIEKEVFNVGRRGALSPGLAQIRFMQELAETDFFKVGQ